MVDAAAVLEVGSTVTVDSVGVTEGMVEVTDGWLVTSVEGDTTGVVLAADSVGVTEEVIEVTDV